VDQESHRVSRTSAGGALARAASRRPADDRARTASARGTVAAGNGPEASPNPVENLESQIEASRRRLDAYVSELDRRRHGSLPKVVGIAAGALLLAVFVGRRMLRRRLSRRKDSRSRRDRRRWRVS
jgi:hypothetical protein